MNVFHRYWFKRANGPLPDPLPRIVKGKCPGYGGRVWSCCNHPDAIYLIRSEWRNKEILYHETGHWFDFQYLTDQDREEIRARFAWPRTPWCYLPGEDPIKDGCREPNCERFARAYEDVLLHPRKHKWLRRKLRAAKARASSGS